MPAASAACQSCFSEAVLLSTKCSIAASSAMARASDCVVHSTVDPAAAQTLSVCTPACSALRILLVSVTEPVWWLPVYLGNYLASLPMVPAMQSNHSWCVRTAWEAATYKRMSRGALWACQPRTHAFSAALLVGASLAAALQPCSGRQLQAGSMCATPVPQRAQLCAC